MRWFEVEVRTEEGIEVPVMIEAADEMTARSMAAAKFGGGDPSAVVWSDRVPRSYYRERLRSAGVA